ncbi:molecular chaperone DnaK, partial [bacterium]|nr:molecular chaperone DnaK [bacterium]
DDIDEVLKSEVESKIRAVEETLKGDDAAIIKTATDSLMQSMQKLASKAYEKASAANAAAGKGPAGGEAAAEAPGQADTVDAEYEVVDD